MQITKPTWYLKQPCPCCGQGFPSFCTCPNCGYLTIVCEEMGDTFIHPKNLDEGFTEICPQCKKTKTTDFTVADSDAIINAGFKKEDYE